MFAGADTIATAWTEQQAATKQQADLPSAKEMIARHRGDPDPVIEELVDLYGDAYAEELGGFDDIDRDDMDDEGTPTGRRWAALVAGAAAYAATIIAAKGNDLAQTLVDYSATNVADALTDALNDDDWATSWIDHAGHEASVTADAAVYETRGSAVRIKVQPGECDFCEGYDGRVLSPDNTSGLPPLHLHCICQIEEVTDEEPTEPGQGDEQ